MKQMLPGVKNDGRRGLPDILCSCWGECLFIGLTLVVLWLKFHTFNLFMSSRHTLTLVTFAGNMGVLMCLTAPILLLPARLRGILLVILNTALSLLILTDTLYLRYYTDLFSLRNLGLSAQAKEVSDSVLALIRPGDIKYFIDIPVFALLSRLITKKRGWITFSLQRSVALVMLFALGGTFVGWKVDNYNKTVRGALKSLWDRPAVAISTGSLVYHVADAWNIAEEAMSRKAYATEDQKLVEDWLASRESARLNNIASTPGFSVAKGLNLIMIQVESLQGFTVGLKLNGVEVSPNLNRLVKDSLYFPLAYNQTASGNSSDAEFMANTSLYPTAKGVAYMRFAGNTYNSLGSELKAQGYHAIAFHGDRPGFWNRNHMYPTLGFDRYISKNEFEKGEGIGLGLSDRDFFRQSMGYLTSMRDEGKPFFAFLVTLTSHYPFNFGALKEQVTDLPLGELEDTLIGNYLRSIRYVDAQLGEFMDGLEQENLLDESVIVVYGDHPAIPRGDHEALGKLLGRDLSSTAAWRGIQSVPFLVRLPKGELAGRFDMPTGQMDIAPTLASLMGFSIPTAFGHNLLDPQLKKDDKFVIFRNGSYIKGDEWIQPSVERVFNLVSLTQNPYSQTYMPSVEIAEKHLSFSDMLLEGNLIRNINLSKLMVQNQEDDQTNGIGQF